MCLGVACFSGEAGANDSARARQLDYLGYSKDLFGIQWDWLCELDVEIGRRVASTRLNTALDSKRHCGVKHSGNIPTMCGSCRILMIFTRFSLENNLARISRHTCYTQSPPDARAYAALFKRSAQESKAFFRMRDLVRLHETALTIASTTASKRIFRRRRSALQAASSIWVASKTSEYLITEPEPGPGSQATVP